VGDTVRDVDDQRFEISYARWCGLLLGLLGMGRRHSGVIVGPDTVRAQMGWSFDVTIPISSITAVRPYDGRVTGWGVHGWRGRWLVNGSSLGIVEFSLEPPTPSKVVLFNGQLRRLLVSVDDRDGLLAALTT